MKKHIICLGDSNTHGACVDPHDCADGGIRFNESERWTRLLQNHLGDDHLVIEEGLGGRTTVFEDPLHEGMSALSYLVPCLKSHEPVTLLVVMLGTNDVKERFAASPACVGMGMKRLVKKAMQCDCWQGDPRVLIVAPKPIGTGVYYSDVAGPMGAFCAEKSRHLAGEYRKVAEELGCDFFDAAPHSEYNTIDHMHLTKRGNVLLAEALAQRIRAIL